MTTKTVGCLIPMDTETYNDIFIKKMQFYLTENKNKNVQSVDLNSLACYVNFVQQTKRKQHGKT